MVHHIGDGFGGHAHIAQIGLPVYIRGGADGDEDEFRLLNRFGIRRGEGQPSRFDIALNQLLKPGLVDGQDVLFEVGDTFRVDIEADDAVAQVSKTGPADQSHVADANYGNVFHA
ncbi:MAG: hypothetical protein BWY25_02695 [Chloroflexi bacterium ADurb.Bin222]|nr:MAG: hypothetical protein BWY25_02695 [Chloroflexi bacterium ADurb.Bin222]